MMFSYIHTVRKQTSVGRHYTHRRGDDDDTCLDITLVWPLQQQDQAVREYYQNTGSILLQQHS